METIITTYNTSFTVKKLILKNSFITPPTPDSAEILSVPTTMSNFVELLDEIALPVRYRSCPPQS